MSPKNLARKFSFQKNVSRNIFPTWLDLIVLTIQYFFIIYMN